MFPVTILSPYDVGILSIVDYFESVSPSNELIYKAGIVALIYEHFQFLFFLKSDSTDPIAC